MTTPSLDGVITSVGGFVVLLDMVINDDEVYDRAFDNVTIRRKCMLCCFDKKEDDDDDEVDRDEEDENENDDDDDEENKEKEATGIVEYVVVKAKKPALTIQEGDNKGNEVE